jgi:hypothetical protein
MDIVQKKNPCNYEWILVSFKIAAPWKLSRA